MQADHGKSVETRGMSVLISGGCGRSFGPPTDRLQHAGAQGLVPGDPVSRGNPGNEHRITTLMIGAAIASGHWTSRRDCAIPHS